MINCWEVDVDPKQPMEIAMFELFAYNALSLIPASALMYWRGRKYGRKESPTFLGAILRAICWSFLFCWTVLFVHGQGVGVIPLPSWAWVGFELIESVSAGVRTLYLPHLVLSPAIPIGIFLLAYALNNRRTSQREIVNR